MKVWVSAPLLHAQRANLAAQRYRVQIPAWGSQRHDASHNNGFISVQSTNDRHCRW